MGDDRPLHVRVAEVLGWRGCHYGGTCHGDILLPDPERLRWRGRDPGNYIIGENCTLVPRYDESWAHTGPLIERHRLQLEPEMGRWVASTEMTHMPTGRPDDKPYGGAWVHEHYFEADTPIVAVCHLILALAAAGRLEGK